MNGGTLANASPPAWLEVVPSAVGALSFTDLPLWGAALGGLVGGLLRVRRAHVEQAMHRAGVADPEATAGAMYRALGTSALELLWLSREPRDLRALTGFDGDAEERYGELRRRGRGMVLAASHTGNWDLAACAVAARLGPISVVTKRLSLSSVDALWQRTRAGYGVHLVEARGAFAMAREALAAGFAVAMMIDQVPAHERHGVRARFLGEDAWVDRAPATVAARFGVPLVVTASRRDDGGVQRLSILDVLEPPRRAGAAWIDEASSRATSALGRFVLEHPSEWLWMHRRWNAPRNPE
ncbi:MAG TPA: lysophospholipid acyltransferase family protein [Polyangiaceae bacterium]